MVVMSRSWATSASVRHDNTRRPSISTVQAPHWPWSQPFLLPVSPTCSRNASNTVVRASILRDLLSPLTLSVTLTGRDGSCFGGVAPVTGAAALARNGIAALPAAAAAIKARRSYPDADGFLSLMPASAPRNVRRTPAPHRLNQGDEGLFLRKKHSAVRHRFPYLAEKIVSSISQRATVLAGIGTADQRALVPVDPNRLAAAERTDHAAGLVPDLLQALDDLGRHAVLELVDALVMQAARHIDGLLHVAAIVEHVGQHVALPDRLILPAHHAERHDGAAVFGGKAGDDGVQRPLARPDAVGMAGLDAETTGAVLQQDACLVGDDRRTEGMCDRIDERTDVAVL